MIQQNSSVLSLKMWHGTINHWQQATLESFKYEIVRITPLSNSWAEGDEAINKIHGASSQIKNTTL